MIRRILILVWLIIPLATLSQRHKRGIPYGRRVEKVISQEERANAELESAKALYKQGNYDSSIQKFIKVLKWAQKHHNSKVESGARHSLQSLNYSNLSSTQVNSLNEALERYKQENKKKDVQMRKGELERIHIAQKSRLSDSLLLVKDSLLRTQIVLTDVVSRENKLKSRLKDQLIDDMARRGEEEKQLRLFMQVGLGIVLFFGSIIFYQYKKQKSKNRIIERQKDELQTLMKEIHHRVKNNLQVISSLLDLQSQLIEDHTASAALKEGKNRVLSMALIHQNLYGDGNIKKIKVKKYIQSLSAGLIDSYNIDPGNIKVTTDIDDLDLDVDTVIPLGLILNELISNSLKHAFKKGQQGEIHILLKEKDGTLLLNVKDSGQGFVGGSIPSQSTSFGMKLITSFAKKLKAKVEMYNDHGACVSLHILKYKPTSN